MNTRRKFITSFGTGIIAPILLPFSTLAQTIAGSAGAVVNDEEGEAFQMRDGTSIVRIKFVSAAGKASLASLSEVFRPGDALPVHKHLHEDEVIFIHKGSGLLTLDDRQYSLREGAIAFIPKGIWHGLENNGNESIDMRFCYSPAGFEGFFREVGTPAGIPFVKRTMDERRAIAKKWGMIYKL